MPEEPTTRVSLLCDSPLAPNEKGNRGDDDNHLPTLQAYDSSESCIACFSRGGGGRPAKLILQLLFLSRVHLIDFLEALMYLFIFLHGVPP